MALDMTKEEFNTLLEKRKLTQNLLNKLGKYLEENRKTPEIREMGRYLQSGRYELSAFTCRQDVLDPLIQNLTAKKIPFIIIKNNQDEYGLIIKTSDEDDAQQTIEETLKRLSHYIEVLNDEEFKNALVAENTSDKSILSIMGLREEEAENLLDIMRGAYDGISVGMEYRQDGTLSLLLHAKSMMKKKKGYLSINLICLQNTLELNGANAKAKQNELKNRITVSKLIATNFESELNEIKEIMPGWGEDTGYICGGRNQYIKITKDNFEYGHIEKIEDTINYEPTETLGYEHMKELKDLTATFKSPFYTRNKNEADNYFKTNKAIAPFEKELAVSMDVMISDKIKTAPIMKEEGRWSGKFRAYIREASAIAEGFSQNLVPEGYSKEQMQKLWAISSKYNVNPKDYSLASEAIKHTEVKDFLAAVSIKETIIAHDETRSVRPIRADVDREGR